VPPPMPAVTNTMWAPVRWSRISSIVDEAATRIREEVDADANIIVGATFDESLDGIIRVSVVATGAGAWVGGWPWEDVAGRTLFGRVDPALPGGWCRTRHPGRGCRA
jgi:hypothetical protein